jgi:thiol-disulfide isomerase/thioredoxin
MLNPIPRAIRFRALPARFLPGLLSAAVLSAAVASGCGGAPSAATPADEGEASVSTPALGEVNEAAAGTPSEALALEGVDPITGENVSLADFAGKPIVLNFWASWCPPCREEIPALVELAEAHPQIQVVGVNLQDAAGDARALQEEIGFDFPSIADTDGTIAQQLGVIGMPTTFFLDAEHRITGQVVGGTDVAGFEEGLGLTASDGP